MQFKELPVSETFVNKLLTIKKSGKVPHALMFSGKEGSGNLAVSIAFAQYLLCDNPGETDSCGTCSNCTKIEKLIHPDLFFSYPYIKTKGDSSSELSTDFINEWRSMILETPFPSQDDWLDYIKDEKSKNKKLNLYSAEVRNISKRLSLKSHSGKKKIIIIWLPEYLGKEGNILLKHIEEPSDETIFFFVTEDESKILTTILSRTQRIYVPVPELDNAVNFMLKTIPEADKDYAISAYYTAKGNINKAIKILNNTENPFSDIFISWMRFCYTGKMFSLTELLRENELLSNRERVLNFLNYSLELIHEIFQKEKGALKHELPQKEKDFSIKFAETLEDKSFEDLYYLINDAISSVESNGNVSIIIHNLSNGVRNVLLKKNERERYYGMY